MTTTDLVKAGGEKVGFISLGCPKALVDSERILTQLRIEGYDIALHYEDAGVVIANTCGFIDGAKEESLEAIGEAIRENGKVLVTGCMGRGDVKQSRWEAFMAGQQSISAKKLQQKVGATQMLLIDSVSDNGSIGRTSADAPEIGGVVHLPGVTEFQPGDWVEAEITGAVDYDLWVS